MRRRTEHDEPPEFWTAYADLLLTVLVIFIVVATAQIAEAKSGEVAKAELEKIRRSRTVNREAIEEAIRQVEQDGLLSFDSATGVIRLQSEVLFESESAAIRDPGVLRRVAGEVLPRLLKNPKVQNDIVAIGVEGHTSTDGSYGHNLKLSAERAQAAAEVLLREIPAEHRTRLEELLSSTGHSESKPVMVDGAEDKAKSRRMELHVRFREEERLKALLDGIGAAQATP